MIGCQIVLYVPATFQPVSQRPLQTVNACIHPLHTELDQRTTLSDNQSSTTMHDYYKHSSTAMTPQNHIQTPSLEQYDHATVSTPVVTPLTISPDMAHALYPALQQFQAATAPYAI